MKTLYQLKNLDTGIEIPVMLASATIGRDESSDIVIADEQLSRKHVQLDFDAGRITARDLQSTNGTYHNEKLIRGPSPVEAGDTLRIGGQTLLIVIDERGANQTVMRARVAQVTSYVLEKNSTDGTAIRQGFPTPPGWSAADRAGLDWLEDAESEQILTEELKSGKYEVESASAALLVTIGERRKLYLVPKGAQPAQWSLGRSPASDITVDDLTVSTHHASLLLSEGSWSIRDEDSRNGIVVNGILREESVLEAGDKLRLGRVDILFRPL